jgi:phage baseplate assembly protein W
MSAEYLGRGLSYPVALGAVGLGQSAGVAKVEESMRIILGTRHGERVMRPRFGANLGSLVFAPNNTSTANLARYYVHEALTRWEPRVEVLDVDVRNGDDPDRRAALLITVTYRLRATQNVNTFDFRFDLEPAT